MQYNPLAQELNDLLEADATPIWRVLSARGRAVYFPKKGILGQTAEAKGKALNATIGIALRDDGKPMALSSLASHVDLPVSESLPYAPSYGLPALRDLWSMHIQEQNPALKAAFSKPIITAGLTHSLSVAGALVLDPGDTLIVPSPCWDNYGLIFEQSAGASLQFFDAFEFGAFNTEGLRDALISSEGKVVLLLNFPNNPTGYTPTLQETKRIVEVIREAAEQGKHVVVLLDDAYIGFVYEDNVLRTSLFEELADLHERVLAVKIDGASKEQYAWGLRVGFLTYGCRGMTASVRAALEEKTAGFVRASVSNACHLSQSLLLASMNAPSYAKEREENFVVLQKRFEASKACLSNKKFDQFWKMLPCNSGYFLCIQLRDGLDAEHIRHALLTDFDVGVIALPGNLLRIAFSSVPEAKISVLFQKIFDACSRVLSPSLV